MKLQRIPSLHKRTRCTFTDEQSMSTPQPFTVDSDLVRVRMVRMAGRPRRMAEVRMGRDLFTWFPPDNVHTITAHDVLREGFRD